MQVSYRLALNEWLSNDDEASVTPLGLLPLICKALSYNWDFFAAIPSVAPGKKFPSAKIDGIQSWPIFHLIY